MDVSFYVTSDEENVLDDDQIVPSNNCALSASLREDLRGGFLPCANKIHQYHKQEIYGAETTSCGAEGSLPRTSKLSEGGVLGSVALAVSSVTPSPDCSSSNFQEVSVRGRGQTIAWPQYIEPQTHFQDTPALPPEACSYGTDWSECNNVNAVEQQFNHQHFTWPVSTQGTKSTEPESSIQQRASTESSKNTTGVAGFLTSVPSPETSSESMFVTHNRGTTTHPDVPLVGGGINHGYSSTESGPHPACLNNQPSCGQAFYSYQDSTCRTASTAAQIGANFPSANSGTFVEGFRTSYLGSDHMSNCSESNSPSCQVSYGNSGPVAFRMNYAQSVNNNAGDVGQNYATLSLIHI